MSERGCRSPTHRSRSATPSKRVLHYSGTAASLPPERVLHLDRNGCSITSGGRTGQVDGQGHPCAVVGRPSAGLAAAALPNARIAVDHFHLIMLANRAVTTVRQRITRDLLGRRGRAVDPLVKPTPAATRP